MSIISPALQAVFDAYRLHPEFLGLRLDDVNLKGALDSTLLHIAARKGVLDQIKVLVDEGADINARGDMGNTPLHEAALCGQAAASELLLLLGADIGLKNEFGQTALDVAALGGKAKVCKVLENNRKSVRKPTRK